MSQIHRSQEDIDDILVLAKLNKDDLLPTTQTIHFSSTLLKQSEYKFLQLNPKLETTLKKGDILRIHGEDDDNAVLCTEDTTYELFHSETSNSLLLVKDLQFREDLSPKEGIVREEDHQSIHKVVIKGVFYVYLEVVQRKPQFDKLRQLLEKTTFKGPEREYEVNADDLFTFEQLSQNVQASRRELQAALHDLQAITIDDKLRLLDFEYHFRVLSFMLKIVEENSWQPTEVDYAVTLESLSALVPSAVLRAVFELYAEETLVRDGIQLYKYDEFKVCRLFAQVLLHSAGKFNLREFLQAWQESVPEGMATDEAMLRGVAIVDRRALPSVVWAFPERSLPLDVNDRFKALFDAKEKWRVDEIAPYVRSVTNDKQDVNALLTKHARPSKIDGVKYYSSKHAK